jgi:hypothetical protein
MATLARSFSLAEEQRQQLFALVRCGKTSARAITRAHVLLQCGKGEDAGIIARRIGLCANTVHDILRRFTMQQIQQITALACQKPPLGHAHWTLDLLKEEIIKQNIAPTISRYTITNILHHHDLRPWREKNVVR